MTGGRMANWRAFVLFLPFLLAALRPAASANKKQSKLLAPFSVLVVQNVSVDSKASEKDFDQSRSNILQAEIVARAQREKVFDRVVDGRDTVVVQAADSSAKESSPALQLSTTVTAFHPAIGRHGS